MSSQIFYVYGFSLLLLSKVYGVYWNETDYLNGNGRDGRRIRNKLVTFDTTETDIELAFQFNVPFIAVPTDRSAGNNKNSITSFVNLNLGSVALAGVMIVFGTITSYLWTTFVPKLKNLHNNKGSTNTTTTDGTDDTTTGTDDTTTETDDTTTSIDDSTTTANENKTTGNRIPKPEQAQENDRLSRLMDLLEATMSPSVCVQQYICSLSKSSSRNIIQRRATSSDKIISGIFGTPWILDIITGSAVQDAIQYGESAGDCHKKFSKCGFGGMDSEELFKMFIKSMKVIK